MYPLFEIIGEKTEIEIDAIKKMVDFSIPNSYLNFIGTYGYGVISTNIEYLNIIEPDKYFFKRNFAEYIDLWDWKDLIQKKKIINSLLVAHTFDGQHIYCTKDSFLILPKFEDPIEFSDFEKVILYYTKIYKMNNSIKFSCHKGH